MPVDKSGSPLDGVFRAHSSTIAWAVTMDQFHSPGTEESKYFDTPFTRIYNDAIMESSAGFCLTDKFFTCDSAADTSTNNMIILYGDIWSIIYIPRLEPI